MTAADLVEAMNALSPEGVRTEVDGDIVRVYLSAVDLTCSLRPERITATDVIRSPFGGVAVRLFSEEDGKLGVFAILAGEDAVFAPDTDLHGWDDGDHVKIDIVDLPPLVSWREALRTLGELEELALNGGDGRIDHTFGKITAVRYFLNGAAKHLGIDTAEAESRWTQVRSQL